MKVFTKAEGIYTKTAEKYKRGREQIRISKPIEFEGNLYRQVVYNPSF